MSWIAGYYYILEYFINQMPGIQIETVFVPDVLDVTARGIAVGIVRWNIGPNTSKVASWNHRQTRNYLINSSILWQQIYSRSLKVT